MHQTSTESTITKLLQPLHATHLSIYDESHLHAGHKIHEDTVIGHDSKGTHIRLLIVADIFDGMSRIKRHQMIYKLLVELMDNPIHALALKTYTTNEFKHIDQA